MREKRIGFALVGCGRISRFHVEALRSAEQEATIAAVCDIVPERARATAGMTEGARAYTDYEAMLRDGGFDCVSICTPSGLHPRHGILAAEHGFHVLTEKPAGIDVLSVDRMIETCSRLRRRLFVMLQNRLNPTVLLMRQALEDGRFGRLFMGQANVFWTRPQAYYDEAPWRGTLEMDGGAFMNQACHYVDLMQWMMGDPEQVTAITGTLGRNIEAEDTGSAVIRFRSGAIGSINVTMLVHPANLEGSFTLMGETGTARLGGVALNTIADWKFDREFPSDMPAASAGYAPPTVYGHGHAGFYRQVIAGLRGGDCTIPDGLEGRRSVRLILAIYESARTGMTVRL